MKRDLEEAIHVKKRKSDCVSNSLNEVHLLPPPNNKGGIVNILMMVHIYAILVMRIFQKRRQFITDLSGLEKSLTDLRGISEILPYMVVVSCK
jgi:hypothetical protein